METPKTIEGELTEKIMAAAVRKLGKFPTHNYNALYSAVLETLNIEIPKIQRISKGMSREEFLGWSKGK